MTTTIIIALCSLLLIAYVFDLTSAKTKIPSVVLLLLLGWIVRQVTDFLQIHTPNFSPILSILGTIGLILIVLEGSLELELNRSKFGLVRQSFIAAALPIIALSGVLALLFYHLEGYGFKDSFTNVIPLCVISSAIAIPSAKNLTPRNREFVIYESSLSDILGVLLFNFFSLNHAITPKSFLEFLFQLFIITLVSFVATLGLSYLLNKIEHHTKFVPIILLVILIYAISKVYHLPGLVFILLFGLIIGNLDELKQFAWVGWFRPDNLNKEVQKFKKLTTEGTFLVRSLFFLLFGFLIETSEVLNTDTLLWAVMIVAMIFVFRAVQLVLLKLPLNPLLFIAPRGLITILLFLSIPVEQVLPLVNNSLITQVIILTAFVMMFGLMTSKTNAKAL